jgi:hypothetical protein
MADIPTEQVDKGVNIRETLLVIEDALVHQKLDDYSVATERGTFRWQTIERARAVAKRLPWRRRVLRRLARTKPGSGEMV